MIRVLENNIINKIAAGEVVERPLSVVKELVENAIDSGARTISVEIKDGGISAIKVLDDGAGIAKSDVKTAFLRHATSKIVTFDDLTNVATLGFRGEALSSIAAVSQIEMLTKSSEDTATKIEIDGGKILSLSDCGAAGGTAITVRNLFHNVPVRRKFLKTPAAESAAVHEFVIRAALSRPDISFRFTNNGKLIFATAGDPRTVVSKVYGKEISDKLLPVRKEGVIGISGFIGKPEIARNNRSYENFFVNGRFVKSSAASKAVGDAFIGRLTNGKFPLYILYMDIPAPQVDVNVHPQKTEVRFSDEEAVYNALFYAVSATFEDATLIQEVRFDTNKPPEKPTRYIINDSAVDLEKMAKEKLDSWRPAATPVAPIIPVKKEEPPVQLPVSQKKEEGAFLDYTIVGQIFNTYWLITERDNLYLIDQHAARDRQKRAVIVVSQILQNFLGACLQKYRHACFFQYPHIRVILNNPAAR
ncbi:hypothetical protein AGMMS49975_27280 [Clostridia bacterium]|nr:hypothetical protein AGMMS49975_27280 [Clostridia bacterium]